MIRLLQKQQYKEIILVDVVNTLPRLGITDHVPDPVLDTSDGDNVCLLSDILSPVGSWSHWSCHTTTTAPETGQQEENYQDVGAGGHTVRSILASSQSVSSSVRLEQVGS